MEKKARIIDENTLIPISLLVLVLIGVLRVESTSFKANANVKEISKLNDRYDKLGERLDKISEDLAKIKGALNVKDEK